MLLNISPKKKLPEIIWFSLSVRVWLFAPNKNLCQVTQNRSQNRSHKTSNKTGHTKNRAAISDQQNFQAQNFNSGAELLVEFTCPQFPNTSMLTNMTSQTNRETSLVIVRAVCACVCAGRRYHLLSNKKGYWVGSPNFRRKVHRSVEDIYQRAFI